MPLELSTLAQNLRRNREAATELTREAQHAYRQADRLDDRRVDIGKSLQRGWVTDEQAARELYRLRTLLRDVRTAYNRLYAKVRDMERGITHA